MRRQNVATRVRQKNNKVWEAAGWAAAEGPPLKIFRRPALQVGLERERRQRRAPSRRCATRRAPPQTNQKGPKRCGVFRGSSSGQKKAAATRVGESARADAASPPFFLRARARVRACPRAKWRNRERPTVCVLARIARERERQAKERGAPPRPLRFCVCVCLSSSFAAAAADDLTSAPAAAE